MGLSKFRPVNVPAASGVVVGIPAAPGNFAGFTLYNSSAVNPVTVEFYDGVSAAGKFLGAVYLDKQTGTQPPTVTNFYGDDGVAYMTGVFANYIGTTPAVKGSVFYS